MAGIGNGSVWGSGRLRGAPETHAKGGGLSPPPFSRLSGAPGAAQTPEMADFKFKQILKKTTKPQCSAATLTIRVLCGDGPGGGWVGRSVGLSGGQAGSGEGWEVGWTRLSEEGPENL